ncbi:MAG: hypothetical protein ACQSGP_23335 [Frankia sp.]
MSPRLSPAAGRRSLTGRRTGADPAAARGAVWVLVTGGLAVLFIEPMAAHQPLLFGVNIAVAVSFSAAGAIVWDEPGQRATAIAFAIASILWPAAWLNEWRVGPYPLISTLVGPTPVLVAAWGLLRFPRPWFSGRAGRRVLALLVFVATWIVPVVVFSRPAWNGFPPDGAWPTIWPNRTAFHAATLFYDVGTIAVTIGFGALFVIRPSRMSGPDRRYAVPVAWATGAAGLASAVTGLGWMLGDSENVRYWFSDVEGCVLVGVPAAILAVVIRRRLDGGRVAAFAQRLRGTSDIRQVRSALREMLSDPSAQLWYWMASDEWLDADGVSGPPPDGADGQLVHPVPGTDGAPLALLTGDRALARDRALVETAARAVASSLEIGRRLAALQAEIAGVARSTARMTEAVDAEQARFAHALEEGTQRRLERLETRLGDLGATVEEPATRQVLGDALRQLRETRHELNLLARGQAPPILGRAGLAAAVGELVTRMAVPRHVDDGSVVIEVDVVAARFDGPIERAAYFVTAEAVTNAVKHADARRIDIVVSVTVPSATDRGATEPNATEPNATGRGATESAEPAGHASDDDDHPGYDDEGATSEAARHMSSQEGSDGRGISGVLEIVVSDDGRGGADQRGHGLTGIARRVQALGGTADVYSPRMDGTRISAWLPLGPRS